MFGNMSQPTKLIVVCTEDTHNYGDYLMQLISLKDDTEEKSVGLKDGSVEAVLWDEKNYKSNAPTLPASAHILFIGSSKLIDAKANNMNSVFNKYGMSFKSLGAQAVMCVDKKIPSKEDYDLFLTMANDYNKSFSKVKLNFLKTANPALKTAGLLLPYVYPAAIYGLITGHKATKEILDQRYTFLTLYSYMELLSSFIEG